MSAKSEFRRARRREREQTLALPPHPVREAEERVARAADDRARYELDAQGQPDPKRPKAARDPLPLLAATTTQRMAGDFYRWAWHATRSTVVAAPIHQGTAIRGEPVPPQEIAMEALAALRLCERAVPEPIRTRWLDPVVVDYRTAASVAEQRTREGGHHVPPQAVTAIIRESLDLLHPARIEWERLEAEGKRARRRERDWAA